VTAQLRRESGPFLRGWCVGRGLWSLAVLTALLPASVVCRAQQGPPSKPFVFTSITLIDGTGQGARPNMTVVIADSHIRQIGPAGQIRIPTGAQIVNASGKFLIPGLWDAHVHLDSLLHATPTPAERLAKRISLPLFVANGITGVRDMGGPFEVSRSLRKDISLGVLAGPRIVAPGPALDGPLGRARAISGAAEGRRGVIALKESGADFVKVVSLIPRDAFFAVADEAKKQGITFAGHVPESVSATEASDAGERSMEHLLGIWQDSSAMPAELKKALVDQTYDPKAPPYVRARIAFDLPPRGVLETFSEEKASRLFQHFAKNQTWQVPTLVEDQSFALLVEGHVLNQAGMKFIPASMRDVWDLPNLLKPFDPQDLADLRKVMPMRLRVVGSMRRFGVRLMAGSDAPFLVVPGFSLHEELVLLVKAGLTPMEALQAATRNPAEFLGLLHSVGTVEEGKLADLVVLDADPLQDIRNTQRINAVVVNGHLYNRKALDQMLDRVAAEVRGEGK
jgi:imidazolonepropionase-like amidohydrolase